MWLISWSLAAPFESEVVTIEVEGRTLSARVTLPKKTKNAPVVLAYPGLGGDSPGMVKVWSPSARSHGALVVQPIIDGIPGWFVGEPKNFDIDPLLFSAWRDWATQQGGDPERVYVTGFSMGAHYAVSVYCSGQHIAGVGLVGMSFERGMSTRCKPERAVPLGFVASVDDPNTSGRVGSGKFQAHVIGQDATLKLLSELNGCSESSCLLKSERIPGDLHRVRPKGFDTAGFLWALWSDSER